MTDSPAQTRRTSDAQSVSVIAPAVGWPVITLQGGLSSAQRRFREELGLPTDRAIVMSGHQAEVWHPGIGAKWFAMLELARRHDALPVWLVVDQDSNDPSRIKYPTQDLQKRTLGVLRPAGPPIGIRPAEKVVATPPGDCAAAARDGLARLLSAVNAHANAPTLAAQYTRAVCDLLGPRASGVSLVNATSVQRTTLFKSFVQSMRADSTVQQLYNRAVMDTGRAGGMRPLGSDVVRGDELPLWRVHASGARRYTYAKDNPREGELLAPRALLLTALFRLAGCELFIHGLGGGVYDRVTDRWLELLRGHTAARVLVGDAPPAPTCVVTATRYLQFPDSTLPTPEAIAYAAWRAHRARFEPLQVGDAAGEARKQSLLAAVRAAGDRPEKLRAYRELHAELAQFRAAHASQLAAIDAQAATLRSSRASAAVRFDRTWPFPLYGEAMMNELAPAVAAAIPAGA